MLCTQFIKLAIEVDVALLKVIRFLIENLQNQKLQQNTEKSAFLYVACSSYTCFFYKSKTPHASGCFSTEIVHFCEMSSMHVFYGLIIVLVFNSIFVPLTVKRLLPIFITLFFFNLCTRVYLGHICNSYAVQLDLI